jgi:subtilisin-like proprotein convertase family protein
MSAVFGEILAFGQAKDRDMVSPAGRSAVLHSQLGGDQDNLAVKYDSATPLSPLSALIGQSMQGNWVLRVADLARVDTGSLNKWSLEVVPRDDAGSHPSLAP